MGQIPYGYRIENGAAVIVPEEAAQIRLIFQNYIAGMSLQSAARAAGHPMAHSTVRRMMQRKCYLGDAFYPAILDKETYARANAEWQHRANAMQRLGKTRRKWFCQYHLTHFIRTRIMQRERYDHSRAFFGLPEAAHRWRCRFFC